MVFNSLTFFIFFGVVLLLHSLPFSWRIKKFNLLWASYLFYAAWNPPFVLLLMLSTVIDWFAAMGIYGAKTKVRRRLWLTATLGVNLGVLSFFKYGNFWLSNFVSLMSALGLHYQPLKMDVILPIGISFYTFVTLSYTLDVYWGKMKPWNSFLDFAMFVTFFPHLVAGPILRAADFLPQCLEPKRPTREEFGWGMGLLLMGLFEKIVLADYLFARVAETVYSQGAIPVFADAWSGTLAFAGQIFCDFAGYSTCAIGIAKCLGFWLPQNFRYPYAAVGFADFWHRWHISLSTWLRDYLYIPLGGNRRGPIRTYGNLFATMLLGGLWHGASWTFVVWGGLHGVYLAVERWLRAVIPPKNLWHSPPVQISLAGATFLLVCVTWVFFRAHSFEQAFGFTASMFGHHSEMQSVLLTPNQRARSILLVLLLWVLHWLARDSSLEQLVARVPWWCRGAALGLLLTIIIITPGEDRAFIYFQF